MATIIVGDDETTAEVAAKLLKLADNQNEVQLRTDLPGAAFTVPDAVYAKYTGRGKRSDAERRENAAEQAAAEQPDPTAIVGDELPDSAKNADPADVDPEIAGPITGDEMPASAINVDPPANGDQPDGEAGDQAATEPEPEAKPKARKRAPRKATKSTPATPAAE